MKKIFASGCYDIIHAGHIEFFKQAKALGDYLIVSFASDEVLLKYKKRVSALPQEHKKFILESIVGVDKVYKSTNCVDPIFDFKEAFIKEKANILVSTEDDRYAKEKRKFCEENDAKYVQLPKSLGFEQVSTTELRNKISTKVQVPLRVDFAGGWLDVPKYSIPGAFIVNCSITPKVSLSNWPYKQNSGLGGSGAYWQLIGKNPVQTELEMGVGWQDPAVIEETGLCVWRSGKKPVLDLKINPDFLKGKMALFWTGKEHKTNKIVLIQRDYGKIAKISKIAKKAVLEGNINNLCDVVNATYKLQLNEGMAELPQNNEKAKKYCGSGFGGYALYLFETETKRDKFLENKNTLKIEPFIKLF
jgi:cytidyltransferase-like protein